MPMPYPSHRMPQGEGVGDASGHGWGPGWWASRWAARWSASASDPILLKAHRLVDRQAPCRSGSSTGVWKASTGMPGRRRGRRRGNADHRCRTDSRYYRWLPQGRRGARSGLAGSGSRCRPPPSRPAIRRSPPPASGVPCSAANGKRSRRKNYGSSRQPFRPLGPLSVVRPSGPVRCNG